MSQINVFKCSKCRKDISKEVVECKRCLKYYHPGCAKIHKSYNINNELIVCPGEIVLITTNAAAMTYDGIGSAEGDINVQDSQDNELPQNTTTESQNTGFGATVNLFNFQFNLQNHKHQNEENQKKRRRLTEESEGREEVDNDFIISKIDTVAYKIDELKKVNIQSETFKSEVKEILIKELSSLDEQLTMDINLMKNDIREMKCLINSFVLGKHRETECQGAQINPTICQENTTNSVNDRYTQVSKRAEIVKNQNKKSVIIVTPINTVVGTDTENLIKDNIDISSLNVKECTMRKTMNGIVIIGCSNEQERVKVAEVIGIKLGSQYSVKIPKNTNLKIKITNIDYSNDEKSNDELLRNIIEQNKLDLISGYENMRLLSKWSVEKYNNITAIVEMNEQIHQNILRKGFLNIGWNKCRVYDYVKVTRCFKCWGFYHIAKFCKKNEICGNCAENNPTANCINDRLKCVLCMKYKNELNMKNEDVEHNVNDKNCPTYKYFLGKLKKKHVRTDG